MNDDRFLSMIEQSREAAEWERLAANELEELYQLSELVQASPAEFSDGGRLVDNEFSAEALAARKVFHRPGAPRGKDEEEDPCLVHLQLAFQLRAARCALEEGVSENAMELSKPRAQVVLVVNWLLVCPEACEARPIICQLQELPWEPSNGGAWEEVARAAIAPWAATRSWFLRVHGAARRLKVKPSRNESSKVEPDSKKPAKRKKRAKPAPKYSTKEDARMIDRYKSSGLRPGVFERREQLEEGYVGKLQARVRKRKKRGGS